MKTLKTNALLSEPIQFCPHNSPTHSVNQFQLTPTFSRRAHVYYDSICYMSSITVTTHSYRGSPPLCHQNSPISLIEFSLFHQATQLNASARLQRRTRCATPHRTVPWQIGAPWCVPPDPCSARLRASSCWPTSSS